MIHQYPYTDFHDMNLDWIIGKIKNVEDSEKKSEEYKNEALSAKDVAVQAKDTAVQAKDTAVQAKDTAVQAKDDAVDAKNDAQDIVSDTVNQINVLQARVDNIIPDGTQTVGNTELLDIRVGNDGVIYSSAGNAVRGQTEYIRRSLFDADDATSGKRFDGAGGLVDDPTCFISDFIPVIEGTTYVKNSSAEDAYHRMVYYVFPIQSAWPGNNILVTSNNETTAPAGACYARITGLLSEIDGTSFVEKSACDVISRDAIDNIVEKTINLFNEDDAVSGYLAYDGTIIANAGYYTSGYVKVFENIPVTISPVIRKFMAYHYNKYRIDATFVDEFRDNYTFTPSEDGYIRFTYPAKYYGCGIVQVNTGSDVEAYEPFGLKIKDDIYVEASARKLSQKTVYSFGDSLLYGHYSGRGMIDSLVEENGMLYTKYATNGADILSGAIETQVNNASNTVPDFIVFDGLMNDTTNPLAYGSKLGSLSNSYVDTDLDTSTFYGAFEHLLYTVRTKYMNSNIIFVCCHRTPSRTLQAQNTLQTAVRECCEKWSIPYVDIFNDGQINCYFDDMRNAYSYDNPGDIGGGNGTHLTGTGYDLWYAPLIKSKMLSLLQ